MNAILERLIEMDRKNRLHHGFLFIGGDQNTSVMDENTKSFIAHMLSKDLPEESAAMVRKKLESKNHPDFFRLHTDDSDIKIETIRELQKMVFSSAS